jgi:hypothetical protein
LEAVRVLWWSPSAIAARYEVWGVWAEHGAGLLLEGLQGLSVGVDDGVMVGGERLWGPMVDMVCPPGATGRELVGTPWGLRVCAQAWLRQDQDLMFGLVVPRPDRVVPLDPDRDPGPVWEDTLRAWANNNIPGLYIRLGEELGMCDQWFSHTSAQVELFLGLVGDSWW